MKIAAVLLGIMVLALALCWAAGFVEFTYPNVVPNQPLLDPQKVTGMDGTNILLESGSVVNLQSVYSAEPLSEKMYVEISNQVSRSGFEIDVEPKHGREVELYVRWPRKFRDSAPPFTIPIIHETVGRCYRKPLAYGTFVGTNSEAEGGAK
jgi:hypothetical protein